MQTHNPFSALTRLNINDQGFAFDPVNGASYTLNDTASRIIRELAAGNSSEQVTENLADWFLVDIDEIRSDVRDFIEQLRCRGLTGGEA